METPLESHLHATPRAIGGNIHNEHLQENATVALYKAVVAAATENYMLCHVGDYILYRGVEEVFLPKRLLHEYIMYQGSI